MKVIQIITIFLLSTVFLYSNLDKSSITELEVSPSSHIPSVGQEYTNHIPILINGDTEFAQMANDENWEGSGSQIDPYLLNGFQIEGYFNSNLIDIRNTNVHFQINGCKLNQGFNGIYIYQAMNCKITNNIIINNNNSGIIFDAAWNWDFGIPQVNYITENVIANNTGTGVFVRQYIVDVSQNTINNNSEQGIEFIRTLPSVLKRNRISYNKGDGIYLYSKGNIIEHNIFIDNGLTVHPYPGGVPAHFSDCLQESVLNNTINGKKLIFWQNETGRTVPEETGQVILVNCSAIKIFDQILFGIDSIICPNLTVSSTFITGKFGIRLQYSPNSIVRGNSISNSGIFLSHSSACIITNNTIVDGNVLAPWSMVELSGNGIHLSYSNDCFVSNNTLTDTIKEGITLRSSGSCEIKNNWIIRSKDAGITIGGFAPCPSWDCLGHYDPVYNSMIMSNYIIQSATTGIQLNYAIQSFIAGNVIASNVYFGIFVSVSSEHNQLLFNSLYSNKEGNGSQACDMGLNNTFNQNYWNEWTEPDNDMDGIIDNPYLIEGPSQNEDPNPLSSPINQTNLHFLFPPRIIFPNGKEILSKFITITWIRAIDTQLHDISYSLYYSSDVGKTWSLITNNGSGTKYTWKISGLVPSSFYLVKIIATCTEGLTVQDTSDDQFTIIAYESSISHNSSTNPVPSIIISSVVATFLLLVQIRKQRYRFK
ncbi:MAG: NosD domain-containing protein [Candidatus Hodarchaeota archaeon]